jgi:alkylhydroperoxidase family enzyme
VFTTGRRVREGRRPGYFWYLSKFCGTVEQVWELPEVGPQVTRRYQALVDHLQAAVLGAGHSSVAVRQAAMARARQVSGRADGAELASALDPGLERWAEKVARHAYTTTDAEVAALLAAGYTEDQIFEITVAAALGAAQARAEFALEALEQS